MLTALDDPAAAMARANELRTRVSLTFTVPVMTRSINDFYADRLAALTSLNP
jgi:hypothetical protein